jgi:hypothetical protein
MKELIWPGFYYDHTDEGSTRRITPSCNLVGYLMSLSPENARQSAHAAGAQVGEAVHEVEGTEQLSKAATAAVLGGLTLDNIHGGRSIAESYISGVIEHLVAPSQVEEVMS